MIKTRKKNYPKFKPFSIHELKAKGLTITKTMNLSTNLRKLKHSIYAKLNTLRVLNNVFFMEKLVRSKKGLAINIANPFFNMARHERLERPTLRFEAKLITLIYQNLTTPFSHKKLQLHPLFINSLQISCGKDYACLCGSPKE